MSAKLTALWWLISGTCAAIGFLVGHMFGTRRYPLGTNALARECEEQRKRADEAEAKMHKILRTIKSLP